MGKKQTELGKIRAIVKEAVIQELGEQQKQKAMHDVIVDVTKAAAVGMKAIEALKSKALPTQKASEAVSSAITALEHIFQDMSTNPTRYLDVDPAAMVQKHVASLDSREASLRDSQDMGNGRPTV
jgi:hypothetical protein